MAEAHVQKQVTLILTEKEALWLKAMTQNKLMSMEDSENAKIRKEIWEALNIVVG
jgi:hypothetical protein